MPESPVWRLEDKASGKEFEGELAAACLKARKLAGRLSIVPRAASDMRMDTMTYQQALQAAKKLGASKAEGNVLLAMICQSLASIHAINPALVYQGAVKQGMDGKALVKLADTDPVALGDLMFV